MIVGKSESLGDKQCRMNRTTRGQWDWYARHRAEVEKLIRPAGPNGRICVLGAGNCNDLDLGWLAGAFSEVRLVDIDRVAVERAAERQGVTGRVALEGPVDLTGICQDVRSWRGRAVPRHEVERATATVGGLPLILGGGQGFDVVLSPCVLSQLLCGVRDVLGQDHPGWRPLKGALIRRHLRDVMALTRPGGRAVFVVDLSSTSAIAGLERAREEHWRDLMRLAVGQGKCFRGLEPAALRGAIAADMAAVIGDVRVSAPWVWHLGWGKAFLCYGLTVTKR